MVNATEHASVESEFKESVIMRVKVPIGKEDEFQEELRERSGGRVISVED